MTTPSNNGGMERKENRLIATIAILFLLAALALMASGCTPSSHRAMYLRAVKEQQGRLSSFRTGYPDMKQRHFKKDHFRNR